MASASSSPASPSTPGTSSFPDPSTIPSLVGKSNFIKWQNAIIVPLTSNPQSSALIFGGWPVPVSPLSPTSQSPSSPTSVYYSPISAGASSSTTSNLPTPTHIQASLHPMKILTTFQSERHAQELTDLQTSRFIRATLAMNVIPFVRQHVSAETLWEQLIYLYGERSGIDMVGGPAVFGVIDMKGVKLGSIVGLQRAPANMKSAVKPSGEEADDQKRLLAPPSPHKDRRLTRESSLGFGVDITPGGSRRTTSLKQVQQLPLHTELPAPDTASNSTNKSKTKKKVTFSFPFRKTAHDDTKGGTYGKTSSTTPNSPLPLPPGSSVSSAHRPSHASFQSQDFDLSYSASRRKSSLTDAAAGVGSGLGTRRNKNFEMEMKSLMLMKDAETPVGTPTEEIDRRLG